MTLSDFYQNWKCFLMGQWAQLIDFRCAQSVIWCSMGAGAPSIWRSDRHGKSFVLPNVTLVSSLTRPQPVGQGGKYSSNLTFLVLFLHYSRQLVETCRGTRWTWTITSHACEIFSLSCWNRLGEAYLVPQVAWEKQGLTASLSLVSYKLIYANAI